VLTAIGVKYVAYMPVMLAVMEILVALSAYSWWRGSGIPEWMPWATCPTNPATILIPSHRF